jgi:F-type H+-transporting ATPase subunit delta
MTEGLSRRYAKALFQLAREEGHEEDVGREIEEFYSACTDSELQHVLTNPAFGLETRKKVLVQVTRSQQLSSLTTRFLSLLLERDRLPQLAAIVATYRSLLNDARGRVETKVVGPGALDRPMLDQLRTVLRKISGKEVVLHEETDPALIGGVLVELEGKIYDGSVRAQLEKMKERIARER